MSMMGDPPGKRRETPPFWESATPEDWARFWTTPETSTRTSTGQRQAAKGVDRYLVHLELAGSGTELALAGRGLAAPGDNRHPVPQIRIPLLESLT